MSLLLVLMRSFSIRMRMMSAIGVVLALLVLVGLAGAWGMRQVQHQGEQLIEHSVAESAALAGLQSALGEVRRFERELLIARGRPDEVGAARRAWDQALEKAQLQVAAMLEGENDEDNRVLEVLKQDLAQYVGVVRPVAEAMQSADPPSMDVAWQGLAQARQRFETMDAQIAQIGQLLAAEAAATAQEAERAVDRAQWLFLAALALAVLVVVPTTIANMVSICRPLEQAQGLAVAIARGDLTTRADLRGKDELGELMACLADMQSSLARTVGEVRQSAQSIRQASVEIASGNQHLSGRTEQAASSLQQTASSLEQLTGHVAQSAQSARAASSMAGDNALVAQRGGEVVGEVVETMARIQQSSQKIHDIIGVIDGIAFQTNILALNAAVEAARAGEAGRGFAVVAGEVRSLAQRSAEAAREIKQLIGASVDRVQAGTAQVQEAGRTIGDIVDNARRISAVIGEITTAAADQSSGLSDINGAVVQLDQMTQQNSALVEQSAAAAESLQEQAQKLNDLVSVFRLGQGHEGHSPLHLAETRGHGHLAYGGPDRRRIGRD
jgi:methyl-accepting chemotaxis protein